MLKRAVDIGGVEMVIQEKAKKEEEKVDVVKEKPVAPQVSRTGKKGQQQRRLAYPLGKPPKKRVNGILSQVVFEGSSIIQCLHYPLL